MFALHRFGLPVVMADIVHESSRKLGYRSEHAAGITSRPCWSSSRTAKTTFAAHRRIKGLVFAELNLNDRYKHNLGQPIHRI